MVSFSNVTVPATPAAPASGVSSTVSTADNEQGATVRLEGKAFNDGVQAQGAGSTSSSESSDSEVVKQLKALIKDLQKQLAEEQQQLSMILSQRMDEQARVAAVSGKQTSIASLSDALMTATAQLLEALMASGGDSAGNMVSALA